MEQVAINPWAALAYLVAGVCFILALRGLSSPVSSQRGNRFGMIGMAIAVVTTLVTHAPVVAARMQACITEAPGSTIRAVCRFAGQPS